MLTWIMLGDGDTHAAYFAALHPCADPANGWPEMWIDAVFSESWDEGVADRTMFGCRIGYVEGEGSPVCTLVDAATEHPDTAAFATIRGMTSDLLSRAAGLALGFAADRVFADPARRHPVAGFGAVAQRVEHVLNRPAASPVCARGAGIVFAVGMVGGAASIGVATLRLADVALRRHPAGLVAANIACTAAATWVSLGGTSLLRIAGTIGDALAAEDLDGAREWLPWLCGREPYLLDAQELARATVESVAENTADAHVAPVVWGAVAGAPGILAYRAANTLDAMVGHRSERYENFGWAAARLDDLLNWIPARIAGVATIAAAPSVGGRMRDAAGAWVRDARGHPSPNAGVVESTAAGALGVELGGRTPYAYGVEFRGLLNAGAGPAQAGDIARAGRLERRVQGGIVAAAVLALVVVRAARWGAAD